MWGVQLEGFSRPGSGLKVSKFRLGISGLGCMGIRVFGNGDELGSGLAYQIVDVVEFVVGHSHQNILAP